MVAPLILMIVFFYGVTGFAATYPQFMWEATATPVTEAVGAGIRCLAQVRPRRVDTHRFF